jgi:hypothetical protein
MLQRAQFQEFEVTVGPLPSADTIVFKALQTYSDGSVVRWIDEPAGSSEPEHPALAVKLVKGTAVGHDGSEVVPAASARPSSDGGDGGPGAVGIIGLIAGLAGLGLGAVALLRTRRSG